MIDLYLKFIAAYYLIFNFNYLIFLIFSFKQTSSDKETIKVSTIKSSPKVTVIVPAKNEVHNILSSHQSIILNDYPNIEIIIVNDGSTDLTFGLLKSALSLKIVKHETDHTFYQSRNSENTYVIDKQNSGKADSLNLALKYASGEYFLTLDADTIIEKDSIIHAVNKIMSDPKAIAVGGVVRILNGAHLNKSVVKKGHLPSSILAMFQIIEYIRAFYGGRLGLERIGGTTLLSGAFCLFRKDIVLDVGGFDPGSVTEDFEITLKLKKYLSDNSIDGNFHLLSIPTCWTVAPQVPKDLFCQRVRWQKGLIQTLWKYRSLIFNVRLKRTGLITLPYMLIFEALSPLMELSALIMIPVAIHNQNISIESFLGVLFAGMGFYFLVTILSIRLEEIHFMRHPNKKINMKFVIYSLFENFGYRRFLFFARLWGTISSIKGNYLWQRHDRKHLKNRKAA